MSIGPVIVMLAASGLAFAAVHVYERLLAQVRAERDEAISDCEMFSEILLEDAARKRHPSANYGGPNLRIVQ